MVESDIVYRINDRDEIIYVNKAWDAFASSNDGASVSSEKVLDRRLWDFLSDFSTQEIYRKIILKASTGKIVKFNIRCDSPMVRRLLGMSVSPCHNAKVEFRTHTMSEQTRSAIASIHFSKSDSQLIIKSCSWCNRFQHDGDWHEIEDAVSLMSPFERSARFAISHGMCDDCGKRLLTEVGS